MPDIPHGLAAAIRLPASRGADSAAGGLAATPAPGTVTSAASR
jgi:hypothetical protein